MHKSVTCPRCGTTFTAQNRPAAARQQDDTPTTKVRSARWLLSLFALLITGAVVFTIYRYQQPQPSPASAAEVTKSIDKAQDSPAADETFISLTPDFVLLKDGEVEVKKDLVLEFSDDFFTILELSPPDLPELVILPPTVLNIPIVKQPDIKIIKLEPPKVEQKPQQDHQPVPPPTIQPYGDLTWDDDLLTVLKKVQAIEDTKIVLTLGGRGFDGRNISRREDLHKISKLTRRQSVPFIDKEFVDSSVTIKVSPVILDQGTFDLTIHFTNSPGLILASPDKALSQAKQVFGDDADCYFPIYLSWAELKLRGSTVSPKLSEKEHHNILNRIRIHLEDKLRKHAALEPKERRWGGRLKEVVWHDQQKQKLTLLDSGVIYYHSAPNEYSSRYTKAQQDHEKAEHRKKFAGKKNQIDKL